MPWSNDYYPASMKNLAETTRKKAIEIANALLQKGLDEGIAIATAIKNAQRWEKQHYTGGRTMEK